VLAAQSMSHDVNTTQLMTCQTSGLHVTVGNGRTEGRHNPSLNYHPMMRSEFMFWTSVIAIASGSVLLLFEFIEFIDSRLWPYVLGSAW
jgi:hypothetical protein